MVLDPGQMGGIAPPQGLSNTQHMAPPQVPAAPPQQEMAPGQPITPEMAAMLGGAPPAPQKKAPSLIPYDLAKALAIRVNDHMEAVAGEAAVYLGDPQGTLHTGPEDMLRVWRACNKKVDVLFEKIVNKRNDDEILNMVYPLRMPYIRYTRRNYQEQVNFAEYMMELDQNPKYANILGYDLDVVDDSPLSDFPSPDVQKKRMKHRIAKKHYPVMEDDS